MKGFRWTAAMTLCVLLGCNGTRDAPTAPQQGAEALEERPAPDMSDKIGFDYFVVEWGDGTVVRRQDMALAKDGEIQGTGSLEQYLASQFLQSRFPNNTSITMYAVQAGSRSPHCGGPYLEGTISVGVFGEGSIFRARLEDCDFDFRPEIVSQAYFDESGNYGAFTAASRQEDGSIAADPEYLQSRHSQYESSFHQLDLAVPVFETRAREFWRWAIAEDLPHRLAEYTNKRPQRYEVEKAPLKYLGDDVK